MLNKHTTPAFRAALDADRRSVLGRFGALLANPSRPGSRRIGFDSRGGALYEDALQARSRLIGSALVV
jgi:hypothetical protein